MITTFMLINIIPHTVNAQEGYTLKERVDEIYTDVKQIKAYVIANEKRIGTLELLLWIIGGVAAFIGMIGRELLIKYLGGKLNGSYRSPPNNNKPFESAKKK